MGSTRATFEASESVHPALSAIMRTDGFGTQRGWASYAKGGRKR